jgi:hypothetical protein
MERVDHPVGVERIDLDAGVAVPERSLANESVEQRGQIVVGSRGRGVARRGGAGQCSGEDCNVSE